MARPPKKQAPEASKASDAPPPKIIDVDNFIRVRDSVYARLSTFQELIKNFSMDYLRQTNLLLGEGTNFENGSDLASLENALSLLPPSVPIAPPLEEKKERKKRSHDPNAPKRPLTPYFLYMQTARPSSRRTLALMQPREPSRKKASGGWSTMSAHDKAGWDQAYQYNLRLYNARVHSYKSGNANAKLMTDDEALKYAEEYHIPMPTGKDVDVGNDQDAIAEQLGQTVPAEEEEEATAVKTPKSGKKETRKRKTATPAVEAEPAKITSAAPSPEKKRKRTSKVIEEKEPEAKKVGRKKAKSG